ncbi:unnamed protein product [Closterium sp. NIES-54]
MEVVIFDETHSLSPLPHPPPLLLLILLYILTLIHFLLLLPPLLLSRLPPMIPFRCHLLRLPSCLFLFGSHVLSILACPSFSSFRS